MNISSAANGIKSLFKDCAKIKDLIEKRFRRIAFYLHPDKFKLYGNDK
jgi:hypothetical protein